MALSARPLVRSLIGKLPHAVLYEAFYQSARALGIRAYEVNGAAGAFFGPVYDQSVTRAYLRDGAWSSNLVDLFKRFFAADGGTLYDIGANIGLVSIPVARDARVRVVAFEPDSYNCTLLRANVAVAGVTVEIVNAAVVAAAGVLRFARSDYNSGDHRLADDGALAVPAVKLDDYPSAEGKVAVKIDTQGAEPLIFQGGETVLGGAGLVVAEFWPWGMRRMNLDPEPILFFAQRHFQRGLLLRHDQPVGPPVAIANVVARLRALMASGGEHDAADLVLVR